MRLLGYPKFMLAAAVAGLVVGGVAGAQRALLVKTTQVSVHNTVAAAVPNVQTKLDANTALANANTAMGKKDYATAIKDYKEGLADNPIAAQQYTLWLNLGSAYLISGDYPDALTACQSASRVNGKDQLPDTLCQANAATQSFFAALKKDPHASQTDASDKQTALAKFKEALSLTSDKTVVAQINSQVQALNYVK